VERLKRRREFLRVAGAGRKWAAPGLVLQACPLGPAPSAATGVRYGLTVSRKVGGAVVRNRVRRRLRVAAETVLPEHAEPGHDYVLIGRAATASRPFPALLDDLRIALRRVKAYRE
jgi:ribonuclease P protein component